MFTKPRPIFAAVAAALVPAGVLLRPHDDFPGNWPSSTLYQWFLMAVLLTVRPRRAFVVPAAILVAAWSCAVEFAQLCKPPWLQAVRGTYLGRMAIGTSFSWADLPPYPIACAVGAALVLALWSKSPSHDLAGPPDSRATTFRSCSARGRTDTT